MPRFAISICLLVIFIAAAQAENQPTTVGDRLWIWGHPAGIYNNDFLKDFERKSKIEPVDAADYMGIRNTLFISYNGLPKPPLAPYYEPFKKLDRVYWSLVGAAGATSVEARAEVFKLAEAMPNIEGFILDDFFHTEGSGNAGEPYPEDSQVPPGTPFRASLTVEELQALGKRPVRGGELPIMAVVYTRQISPRARAHIEAVDEVCLWTWRPADLANLESNLAALEKLVPNKPITLGCYMFDFAARKPLAVDAMKRQTELGYAWLKSGRVRGLIFLATPNVDIGLDAVEWTRKWVAEVKDKSL